MIPCHSIKPSCLELDSTEYIPSSYDDDDFELLYSDEIDDFLREKRKKFWINPISLTSLKSFSRKFQEDTFWNMVFFHDL